MLIKKKKKIQTMSLTSNIAEYHYKSNGNSFTLY